MSKSIMGKYKPGKLSTDPTVNIGDLKGSAALGKSMINQNTIKVIVKTDAAFIPNFE